MASDSADPASRVSSKKRKLPIWKRVFNWYRGLRLLNKIGVWVIIASIPIGILAVNLARPAYRAWRQANALTIAQNCLKKNDVKGAFAAFRQAIRIDARNPAVWRALAAYLEANPSPDALFVRRRLSQLEPQVAEHRYVLAELALGIGDAEQADAALKEFPDQERRTPRFGFLQAKFFELKGDLPSAEKTVRQITIDDPENADARFALDRLHLLMPGAPNRDESEQRMRQLADGNGDRAAEARRILVQASGSAGDFSLASRNADLLIASKDATAADWTRFLDVEFASQSFTLQQSLGRACDWGLAHPESLPILLDYFVRRGVVSQVRLYFEQNAGAENGSLPIQQVRLGLAIADRDWDKAFGLIRLANPEVPAEVPGKISEAYRAYRANAADALEQWNGVVASAKGNLPRLNTLLQLSTAWEWKAAQENVLWAMTDASPGLVVVWKSLAGLTAGDNNAPGLMRALGGLVMAEPTNFLARDQWLRLQFLLSLGEKDGLAKAARENLDSAPAQVDLRLTYAMLLADQGKKNEALEALKGINPADIKAPNREGDLAFVFAKAGKPAEARAALEKLSPNTPLLDEEVALVARTRAILEGREDKPIKRDVAKEAAEAKKLLEQLHREQKSKAEDDTSSLFESLKRDAAADNSEALEALKRELRSETKKEPTP